jgi:flavin reductase (DIM6/NTAB) family NADH-FMN oxidoreductase RutF
MSPSQPSTDPALVSAIRTAQKSLTSGVYLLTTTASDGSRHGMLVTNLSTIGSQRPAMVICVNAQKSMHRPLERSGRFGVNVLRASHVGLTGVFTGKPSGEARFQHGRWGADASGVPLLDDALASFSCRIEQALSFDSSTLFVGVIEAVRCSDASEPLLYAAGAFRGLPAIAWRPPRLDAVRLPS